MKQVTATGQTVKEAVEFSFSSTKHNRRSNVEIAIVDEGKKGFFGFLVQDRQL